MTVSWLSSQDNGGFPILGYRLYRDSSLAFELDSSQNYLQLSSLSLGETLGLQVSSFNEIGESPLSRSISVVFTNVPSAPASLTLTADSNELTAAWTAPLNQKGDTVSGYRVYVDDGHGGPFTLVFDGSGYPSTYQFTIDSVSCGLQYFVRVTALNSAGEGASTERHLWFGEVSSQPLNPYLISVVPNSALTIGWEVPSNDGCLTILSYTIERDGVEHKTDVHPAATSYSDDISVGGSLGTQVTYRVKALNAAGASEYS